MVQAQISLEWLLEGFRYDLESTARPKTVKYYCGEISRFLRWVDAAGVPSDISLLTKHHIQAFFHYLATTHRDNGSANEPAAIERLRWPYYRALQRFFRWAVNEGYLQNSPMDDIAVKAPQPAPIEPYRPEHIDRMLKVLDYDWSQIYLHIAGKTYARHNGNQVPDDIQAESLNDYQLRELNRLKVWLYHKRTQVRQEKDRADRRQKRDEVEARREAEQPALFEF